MFDGYEGPQQRTAGPRRGADGALWREGFHATRRRHVAHILSDGLVIGGLNRGAMSPVEDTDYNWPNRAYGCHPAFIFLCPTHGDNYSWDNDDGTTDEPVWLNVDLEGLTLYPDLMDLREATHAAAGKSGFWWGHSEPGRDAAPEPLRTYLDTRHVLTYEVLFDAAAETAITLSRSGAVLESIPPNRISVYSSDPHE
jgi:hypothetical protein